MATPYPPPPPMSGEGWKSDPDFDLGWISGLHNIANKTLKAIYGDYDEFKLNEDDLLNFDDLNADTFINDSVGPIIYLSVWAAVLIIFMIVGFCWCCMNKCCCCCRSSFRGKKIDDAENTDPRYELRPYYSERNKKESGSMSASAIVLSIIMAVLLIGFLIMILHTFASNDKTKDSIDRIKPDLDNAIDDINAYITNTKDQLEHTFVRSFETLEGRINVELAACTPDSTCENIETEVRKAVGTTGEEVKNSFTLLSNALTDVQKTMNEEKSKLDDDFEEVIVDINKGMHWFFMLLNIAYCVVFGLVLIGTVLAAFGRSNGMKTGGFLLIRGAIVLMFILGVLAVLELASMFVISGVASNIVCPAIRQLENERETSVTTSAPPLLSGELQLHQNPDQEDGYQMPNVDEILRACKNDRSAYEAFNLQSAYPIEGILEIVKNFDFGIRTQKDLANFQVEGNSSKIGKAQNVINADPIETAKAIKAHVEQYADFVFESINENVGQCLPAYRAINTTVSLFCNKIPAPVASFWWILQFIFITFVLIFLTALFFERVHS